MATQLASRPLRKSRSLAVELVSTLQARIKDGTYLAGMRMPTEAEIMVEHGVNRTVVREAISRLQQAQLVVTQHGIGSFVSESPPDGPGFRIDPVDVATVVVRLVVSRGCIDGRPSAAFKWGHLRMTAFSFWRRR